MISYTQQKGEKTVAHGEGASATFEGLHPCREYAVTVGAILQIDEVICRLASIIETSGESD